MKRLLMVLVAFVIATAPAVADVCRAGCERARQPECPLHQQTPHKCAHDHAIAPGTLKGASGTAVAPAFSAVAVATPPLPGVLVSTDLPPSTRQHAPPLRSPRIVALRI